MEQPQPAAEDRSYLAHMPMLLDKICEQEEIIKLSDLLRMRLVCRQWNIKASKEYSKRTYLCLGDKDNPVGQVTKMYEALTLLQDPDSTFPLPTRVYINYHLFKWQAQRFDMFQRAFCRFLEAISVGIQEIELCHNLKKGETEMTKYNFRTTVSFPQLTKVKLEFRNLFVDQNGYMITLAGHILSNSPKLEEVNIISVDKNTISISETLEDKILLLIPDTVKKLTIDMCMTPGRADALAFLRLQNLTHLTLDFYHADLKPDQVYDLLLPFSTTLISLHIEDSTCKLRFPIFSRLDTLKITYAHPTTDRAYLHDLEPFTVIFPTVTILDISGLTADDTRALFPPGFSAPQIVEFVFPYGIRDPAIMKTLAVGLSKLKRLKVRPAGRSVKLILSYIWEYMVSLEELRISFIEMSQRPISVDSAFTGIPDGVCHKILNGRRWDLENIDIRSVKSLPGVKDLKNLKLLEVLGGQSRVRLTELTGYLGFLELNSSVKLDTDVFQMDRRCLRFLSSRFGKKAVAVSKDHSQERVVRDRNISSDSSSGRSMSSFISDSSYQDPYPYPVENVQYQYDYDPLNGEVQAMQMQEEEWAWGIPVENIPFEFDQVQVQDEQYQQEAAVGQGNPQPQPVDHMQLGQVQVQRDQIQNVMLDNIEIEGQVVPVLSKKVKVEDDQPEYGNDLPPPSKRVRFAPMLDDQLEKDKSQNDHEHLQTGHVLHDQLQASETNDDQIQASETTKDDHLPASETNDDHLQASETNNDQLQASDTNHDKLQASETNHDQLQTSETNDDQLQASETNHDQLYASENNNDQLQASETNDDQLQAGEVSTDDQSDDEDVWDEWDGYEELDRLQAFRFLNEKGSNCFDDWSDSMPLGQDYVCVDTDEEDDGGVLWKDDIVITTDFEEDKANDFQWKVQRWFSNYVRKRAPKRKRSN